MLRRLLGGASAAPAPREERPDPSVSVVIPLYNHARYIGEAIDSALAGGGCVQEVIVVDDGSSDASYAAAIERASADPRLIVWTQPNRGAHAAINAGLARATGRHVAILNSDDAFRPGRLEVLSEMLDRDPDLWMATSGIEFVDADGSERRNEWHEDALAFGSTSPDLGTTLLNGNILVSTSNFVIRRDIIEQTGPFAPLRYAHDLEFALRILTCGGAIGQRRDKLLRYRMHPHNTINEDHGRVRREWAMAAGFYLAGLTGRASGVPPWERLRLLLPVLEHHKILQGATLCAAYLRRSGASTIAQSGMTGDGVFLDTLASCV